MRPPPLPPDPAADSPLRRWERAALALMVLGAAAFGGLVLLRSALQQNRKTDFGVYARAAHVALRGGDIYAPSTCDDNGWHYAYPPTLAVLAAPLADPFTGEPRGWSLPYAVSVAAWYLLGVGCLVVAAHRFASAALPGAVPGSRRWWYARTGPFFVCLGPVGFTLSRGQVNLIVVAAWALGFAAMTNRKPLRAGLWLALAVAVKAIPGIVALYPVVRLDWRTTLAGALGLVLWLVGVPALVYGVPGAVRENLTFVNVVLAPGALGGGDQTRAAELTDATATDSVSFQAVAHYWRNRELLARKPLTLRENYAHWSLGGFALASHPSNANPAANADAVSRRAHWLLSGAMLVATLAAGLRHRGGTADPGDRPRQLTYFGCLAAVMTLMTPVSHGHYYAYAYPLVAGLWCRGVAARPERILPSPGVLALLAAWGAAAGLVLLPFEWAVLLRYSGAGTLLTVGMWAVGLGAVAVSPPVAAETSPPNPLSQEERGGPRVASRGDGAPPKSLAQ